MLMQATLYIIGFNILIISISTSMETICHSDYIIDCCTTSAPLPHSKSTAAAAILIDIQAFL